MLKTENLVPKVYNNQSRDFQFIGRLYDIVLNSVKTNSENLYNCPFSQNCDEQLIDLLTMTLGFSSKHNYNLKQLTSLGNAFLSIIKNKGNIISIEKACNALIGSEGLDETVEIELENNNTSLILYIPKDLSDTNLLKDLLNYILPAGMSCSVIKEVRQKTFTSTETGIVSSVKSYTCESEYQTLNTIEEINSHFKDAEGNLQNKISDLYSALANTTVYTDNK